MRAGIVGAVVAMLLGGGVGTPATHAAPPPPTVTLLGDSTMAAMRWYMYDDGDADTIANNDIREIIANSYDLVFSAESCRRLVIPSCRGREGYVPISALPMMQGELKGQMGQVLVMMAGYDDPSIASGIDAIMAEAKAQGIAHVMWLTYKTSTNYVLPGGMSARNLYQQHNAALDAALVKYPMLQLLDWNTYATAHPNWFASDQIHMNGAGAVGLAQYIKAALDEYPAARCQDQNANAGTPDTNTGVPGQPPAVDNGYLPMTPQRVLDTRDPDNGGGNGPVGAGRTVSVSLAGVALAPGTQSVALSVTAANPCRGGYLTVFACGTRPVVSNVNYIAGRTTAGLAITLLSGTDLCVYSSAPTDVVVDVVGAFAPGGALFHPSATPTRWFDTRPYPALVSGATGVQPAGAQVDIPVAGQGDVPVDATAAWVNLTAASATTNSVLLAFPGPCGTRPLASTVNTLTGRSAAASALVGIGTNGGICVAVVSGATNVVLDISGWFGPGAGGLAFQGTAPTRLLDTRDGAKPAANSVTAVPVDAVSVLNVAAVDAAGFGYARVEPCGSGGSSSLLNTAPNENVANLTAVAPGTSLSVCITPTVATQLIVDRTGVFTAPAG